MSTAFVSCSCRQRGAVLVVSLLLLLVMTILGLSSVGTVVLEEKMSANSYDRSLAFQAAEAALRVGELRALDQSIAANADFNNYGLYTDVDDTCPDTPSPCVSGLCSQPDGDCTERWLDSSFGGWVSVDAAVSSSAGTPQYFIEFLGGNFPCNPQNHSSNLNCSRYRVTARSQPITGRASVMLQSIYAAN